MLQRTTLSPSALDVQQTDLRQLLLDSRIGRARQAIREVLWLPNSLSSFLFFLGIISILTAGLMLHLRLSVQILETELHLESKQAYHAEIERQNAELVWEIGQAMSIERVRERAATLGYAIPTQRYYVAKSPTTPLIQEASAEELSAEALPGTSDLASPAQTAAKASVAWSFGVSEIGQTLNVGWQELSHQVVTWWQGQ